MSANKQVSAFVSQTPVQLTIGDICSIDRTTLKGADCKGLPYIGLENVVSQTGDIVRGDAADANAVEGTCFKYDMRHVLYGKLRPYLNKIAVPSDSGLCSTELVPMLPKPGIGRDYLAAVLRHPSVVDHVMKTATGARMPRADMGLLLSFPLILPGKDERSRIVDVLSHAASIRRLRDEAKAKAREVIPALFVEMFGDPATNPKAWEVNELGAVISGGPQNGLYRPSSDYGDGVPIVRIDSFYEGRVTGINSLRRLRIEPEAVEKYGLKVGDILINRVNSRPYLGKSAIVPPLAEKTVFESNMMRFSVNEKKCLPHYVVEALQQRHAREQLLAKAKDAINQSSINQEDVRTTLILCPPLSLQQEFAERVAEVEGISTLNDKAVAAADQLAQSLMSQVFGHPA